MGWAGEMRDRLQSAAKRMCEYPKDSLGWMRAVEEFNDTLLEIRGDDYDYFLEDVPLEIISLIEDDSGDKQINYPNYDMDQILIKKE